MSADDGSGLLTSDSVGELLSTAVEHAGGTLLKWSLDHIDTNPGQSTPATDQARVRGSYGGRDDLLGVSARAQGLQPTDERAEIFADGDREVAVWVYPDDPDLPGLRRAAFPSSVAEILTRSDAAGGPVQPDEVSLDMIGYRPRRRAVIRARIAHPQLQDFYVKVLRERLFDDVVLRHRLLLDAGVPAPDIAATTDDKLLVLRQLPGRPLAQAIFDERPPTSAEALIEVLDAMPGSVAELPRRPPWSDAVAHYATMVVQVLPALDRQIGWLVDQITEGLRPFPPGNEPTHGDFHEGQVHVSAGRVVGLLDVDTLGPGRRADDLACLIAHLSTIQRMNQTQTARVHALLRDWVPVFDRRVDPVELRLRAAAVIISLATGPYRGQEPDWERDTRAMISSAEALVRQVR